MGHDWTAHVHVGQSIASISGSGTLSVGDVIAQAIGVAQIELQSVTLGDLAETRLRWSASRPASAAR